MDWRFTLKKPEFHPLELHELDSSDGEPRIKRANVKYNHKTRRAIEDLLAQRELEKELNYLFDPP